MRTIFLFDIKSYTRSYITYGVVLLLVIMGVFTGQKFNLTVGEGVYLNAPYTIGFMTGLLSLSVIFIATIFAGQLLFKEWDSRFDTLLFTTPVDKRSFATSRFLAFFIVCLSCVLLLIIGFVTGQYLRNGNEMNEHAAAVFYLYPLLIFGVFNTLLTCAFLYWIAMVSRRKLLVITGGLLLYVFYMVVLLFSNSPFMAGSMPQSMEAQRISALADPFGLSAYFYAAKDFTMQQRNERIVPLTGYLLLNRVAFISIALLFVYTGYRSFSFGAWKKGRRKKEQTANVNAEIIAARSPFSGASTVYNTRALGYAVLSFIKKDLTYIFKSIAMAVVILLLLFHTGMEIYAEIEKGVRLPQKYASSGLMSSTIIENFHFLGLLIVAYFTNDLFWRSRLCGFSLIEDSTFFAGTKLVGHWFSCGILLCCLTGLLILQGLLFQYAYGYFHIDWMAYGGIWVFNTFPLILFAGAVLLVNDRIPNKYLALGISLLLAIATTGSVAQKIISRPLFRIFSSLPVSYSDFSGYEMYLPSFMARLVLGASIVAFLWMIINFIKQRRSGWRYLIIGVALIVIGFFSGKKFEKGYSPVNKTKELDEAAAYEKKYSHYKSLPQPSITGVITTIDLYPARHAYVIKGYYTLKNKTGKQVEKILLNFHPDLKIENARFMKGDQQIKITNAITEILLPSPLLANDTAALTFEISYQWFAVNGHQSFNAIVENGSFMRISRYYPQVGYQASRVMDGPNERKQYALGNPTGIKKLEDPKVSNDFIHLDMTVSTETNQSAAGIGQLVKQWHTGDRNYYHYIMNEPIPFRFAVSSAAYAVKTAMHKGVRIQVLYHPKHYENVERLIENTKQTLDYCITNFGAYPFPSVSFAEISSFTKGFAATAYPGIIYMPEDMLFHANIDAGKEQDVINELAGHEVSHLWWGNNRIAPDEREGAVMLTETLAMYTEMMLYKKMYGKERMMDRVKVHQQIYEAEKGFSVSQPLYKVTSANTHISYSKGAMVMVQLSEMIGEQKVNEALRNFLRLYQYPAQAPVSTDLVNEILQVSDVKYHTQIKTMFEKP